MDFTEDEVQEYEEELNELDLKALLVAQTAELREIRSQLQLLTHALSDSSDGAEETPQYECVKCGTQHGDGELGQHAQNAHNAPPDFDHSSLYERV